MVSPLVVGMRQDLLWVGIACLVWGAGCLSGTRSQTLPRKLMTQSLQGQAEAWSALLPKNRKTLAVFMTVWCDSCERKQPQMLTWARRHQARTRVVFVLSGSPVKEVAALVKKRKIPTSLVKVAVDRNGFVASRFHIKASPTYLLLDPKGDVLGRYHVLSSIPTD